MSRGFHGPKAPDPTPREIRRACHEIQAAWSPRKRMKRGGGEQEEEITDDTRAAEEKITDDTRAAIEEGVLIKRSWHVPEIRIRDLDSLEGSDDYDG